MAETRNVRVPVTAEVTTELMSGDRRSWRIMRMILAAVAVVALLELIIIMTMALVYGIAITQRLAQLGDDPSPAPVVSECVGELVC